MLRKQKSRTIFSQGSSAIVQTSGFPSLPLTGLALSFIKINKHFVNLILCDMVTLSQWNNMAHFFRKMQKIVPDYVSKSV
jgi:hypothetical protein